MTHPWPLEFRILARTSAEGKTVDTILAELGLTPSTDTASAFESLARRHEIRFDRRTQTYTLDPKWGEQALDRFFAAYVPAPKPAVAPEHAPYVLDVLRAVTEDRDATGHTLEELIDDGLVPA